MLSYLIEGFLVKLFTGFDDTLTHIPILANLTKKRKGKIAFAIGIFIALTLAITFSIFFSQLIKNIPYYRYISSLLILLLAVAIYLDLFITKTEKKIIPKMSRQRFFRLIGVGFLAAIATLIDDVIVFSSLFLKDNFLPIIVGIYAAFLLELTVIIYFSRKLKNLKWKKEITSIMLIILAILVFFNII